MIPTDDKGEGIRSVEGSETTASKVRRARLSAGLTQEKLAGEAGISQPYLSFLENGERRFNEETLTRIAKALGMRASSLLGEDDPHANVWQEGFDAGIRAAAIAIDRLNSTVSEDSDADH